jgi:Ca2+-binding EF-hand superfamily protein
MRTRILLLVPLLASLAGCGLFGPDRPPHWSPYARPRDENWHSPAAALLRYDANHDGILTRDEVKAGLKAEFDAYDTAHNNCLGPDQVHAINQKRVQDDASQATPLVDWNQDGCIDFNEYAGATLSLFDTLDANHDGQLRADELRPSPPPGQGGTPDSGGGGRGGHRRGGPPGGGPGGG